MSKRSQVVTLLLCAVPGCAGSSPSPPPARVTAGTPPVEPTNPAKKPGNAADNVPRAATAAPDPSTGEDSSASDQPSVPTLAPKPVVGTSVETQRAAGAPEVVYIGMHIGGGPNDLATKAPFVEAIAAKKSDLERCAAELGASARGTFGIDLLVEPNGGHPGTSNVRTVVGGDDFRKCMVAAFESVTFARPKHGRTKVSYSLRITPSVK
jgi:hypothetical protein